MRSSDDNHIKNGQNGTAAGSPLLASETVRTEVQRVVKEALQESSNRGKPLATYLHGILPVNGNGNGNGAVKNGNGNGAVSSLDGVLDSLREHVTPELNPINLAASLAPRMEAVEAEIERLITTPIKLIADIATHTLSAGGKRLRPALTLLCAQLCGDDAETPPVPVVTCAAAVELTHTTTLLHDDVIDDADTRRGRPTANLLWGNESSVLVGDYLFAQVFVTAARRGYAELMFPLADATAQMCAGELLETQTRGNLDMPQEQYLEIIALKTATLIECSCRLGADAMGALPEQAERLARYGRDLGMAFQIVDDVLDIVGCAGRVGKPVGNDIREGDITLPMLRAMQQCTADEQAELRAIVGCDISDEDVERALQIIRQGDAVPYALGMAAGYIASAKAQLEAFPAGPARDMLTDIADYVLSRDK